MLRKIADGLRYGDKKTKGLVIGISLIAFAGLVMGVVSFVVNSIMVFLGGVALMILAIVLSQSFTLDDVADEESEEENPVQNHSTKRQKRVRNKTKKERITEQAGQQEESSEASLEAPLEKALEEAVEAPLEKALEEAVEVPLEKSVEEAVEAPIEAPANFEAYEKGRLKKILHKYKVKRDHRTILIDEWKEQRVKELPAYIWKHRGVIYILLLEQEPRVVKLVATEIKELRYRRGVECNPSREYVQLKKPSLITTVFEELLPTYHKGTRNGRPVMFKNLYEIANGMLLTNSSAKNVIDLLQLPFSMEDGTTRRPDYNDYFKEIYRLGILCKDSVMEFSEYKTRIDEIIQNMALTEMENQEYVKTLQQLVEHHLISEEYVTFYVENRMKITNRKERNKR